MTTRRLSLVFLLLVRFTLPFVQVPSPANTQTIAAILTKYKPEGAEKAVLRPYTPTSDEGETLSHA